MDQQGDSARDFVLLEDWLNDGAPLAGPMARECLSAGTATICRAAAMVVGGRRIVPPNHVPALVMIPSGDRIVPPLSAAALAEPQAVV